MAKPIAIDLFCGLGGWTEGFLAEGYDVIGFDIERRPYPGQLVLQDILTITGAQLARLGPRLAAIVASPPCTEYSYMAMPWKRAKQIARALRGRHSFPDGYTGSRTVEELNALFDACFRIQREVCEALGRYVPMVVENVKGAQPWVGPAKAAYGSFYLWGDVDSIGGRIIRAGAVQFGVKAIKAGRRVQKVPGFNFHQHEKTGLPGGSFQSAAVAGTKNDGGSWFHIAHNTDSGVGKNPVNSGVKFGSGWWHDSQNNLIRKASSRSAARKDASAQIAKIPLPLAQHIAQVFRPEAA